MWFAEHLKNAGYFNNYMLHRRKGMATWLDVYLVEDETRGWKSDAPCFVDISGNMGYLCAELRSRYPKLPGQIILQDLSYSISQALSTPGVENMVHNIYQPQPIKSIFRSQPSICIYLTIVKGLNSTTCVLFFTTGLTISAAKSYKTSFLKWPLSWLFY